MHAVFATSWPIDNSVFARKQDDLHWKYVYFFSIIILQPLLYLFAISRGDNVSVGYDGVDGVEGVVMKNEKNTQVTKDRAKAKARGKQIDKSML